jgi:hypothetical protein
MKSDAARQIDMTHRGLWCAVLIVALTLVAAKPAVAEQSLQTISNEIVIGIVVVAVALGVTATLLILHYSRKATITGCVNSEGNGLSVTNEKDKRQYVLSGSTAGIKAGDRMTLSGKRKQDGKAFALEVQKVSHDFGACQP